ncbi:LPS assembly lipoprotein LptE [Thalassotalea crassostreae]|uniref:LPS-assembly lipoprotein LptE n=1 Tax=Thalassotalea crassostreae TaxID=1763536 RepID=UPI0009EE7A5A|nr:LPS assembly lipoprotein LptE [Thalassotalea crassostreae]
MTKNTVSIKQKSTKMNAIVSLVLALAMLSGCGFKMRGDYLLPAEMESVYVSSADPHGELTRLFKQHLTINNVNIEKTHTATSPEIRILKDSLNRRTLSLFDNGQVAEYELTYTVRYDVMFKDEEAQRFSFDITRNYQDDPDRALAKSRELTLLRKEMRVEAADRILRNLASISH